MITDLIDVLKKAQKKGYAVPAFNSYNLEVTQAICQAAVIEQSAVIIAISEKSIDYAGLESIYQIIITTVKDSHIPVVIHLDHARNFPIIKKAISVGFTSVMIDASSLDLKKNITLTGEVREFAHRQGVSVEAEIGVIGGAEDYILNRKSLLPEISDVLTFIEATQVDALALALGTAHGLPVQGEYVDFPLLDKVRKLTSVPLVLHGASNLDFKTLQTAIKKGIVKINFDTELRQAFTRGVRESLKDKKCIDPRTFLAAGKQRVILEARKIIKILGANNQA